jgi:hypothetical protein
MEAQELFRVAALRNGKLKPVEFKLRRGEKGLSLFAHTNNPDPVEVIEAVEGAGKQGDLVAAIIPAQELRALGLILVQTRGGTSNSRVNGIHFEARLPFLRRLFLPLRGIRLHDYFNDHFSLKLCALARVLE